MAYKRKTKKSKNGLIQSTTINNSTKGKGGTTHSHSFRSGGGPGFSQRTTHTRQKNGRLKTTVTTNQNGWITRKTSQSYVPKKPPAYRRPKKGSSQDKLGKFIIFIIAILVIIEYISS